ncbi:unnamed protein product [Allacma fusca]|uniref:RING-type domain-containing protein n=1 Tax=Allacma fusca TaxID=39272 RepID=A0A8J2PUM3_9HEXA|nr:unnamed protein product [Allacma fusca]
MSTQWRQSEEVNSDLTEDPKMFKTSTQDQSEQEIYAGLVKKYGCSLCNEVFINAYITNCHHKFCRRCILKWLRYCRKCPECISVISKITPLKRMDAVIEGIYTSLPTSYKTYREQLKKKRFRAELEWKRMKMVQGALSASQISRMKTAVETRQSLKQSKKTKGKSRPVTTGGHSPALPQLSPKLETEGLVRRKKSVEPARVEFIKLPPINYTTQDSSNHVSTASLESTTNKYNAALSGTGPEMYKTRQYSRDDRPEKMLETQFFILNSQLQGSTGASSLENVSNPEVVYGKGKPKSAIPREVDVIKPLINGKAKDAPEDSLKGKGKINNNIDEVEEFLSQCPVESIWESDLFTFLKLHAGSSRQKTQDNMRSQVSKTSRSSRKKQLGSGKKTSNSAKEGNIKIEKVEDITKTGKIHPPVKSPVNTQPNTKLKTSDPLKNVSKLNRSEKNVSKKTNAKKESSVSNPKQRGTTPLPLDSIKGKSKAIVRSSKLELVLSDEDKKKSAKSHDKQSVRKKQNPDNISGKGKAGKGSNNPALDEDDFRKDSLEELLRKFRAERELRRSANPSRPGTAYNPDVNRNLSEIPGWGVRNTTNQNGQELSIQAVPEIQVKAIQNDPPINYGGEERSDQSKQNFQKPLSTADKNKIEKILAGLSRISKDRDKVKGKTDALFPGQDDKKISERPGPSPSRTDVLPGSDIKSMDGRKESDSNDDSRQKSQKINNVTAEPGNKSNPLNHSAKSKKKPKHSEHRDRKHEGKVLDNNVSKITSKNDNHKSSTRKDLNVQNIRSKLAPDRKRPEVRKNRSRIKYNNTAAGRQKDASASGNNLRERRASGEEKINLNGTKIKRFASQPDTSGGIIADRPLDGQERRGSPDGKARISGKAYNIPDYPLGLVQDTNVVAFNRNSPTMARFNNEKQHPKNQKMSPGGMAFSSHVPIIPPLHQR